MTRCTTGVVREEGVYGLTSLSTERADAARLLQLARAHWPSETAATECGT
ncbi:MAG TPA: hypothetical protein VGR27_13200 [Longimicrobiaceae bacterium]|nr:hypothetical protein [Longimicrobiaceae bacterium]